MNRRLLVPALIVPALIVPTLGATLIMGGCEGFTVGVGARDPVPGPGGPPERQPERYPEKTRPTGPRAGPYDHLPQRASFSPRSSVELKEGCYVGDFVLGSSQIQVSGAGIGKTVIHGNLVLKTQCKVSNLTVMGDVIFEGHQAELVDADFFGRIIDKGMQNRY